MGISKKKKIKPPKKKRVQKKSLKKETPLKERVQKESLKETP
ncbi:hypothetical protein HpHNI33_15090 [Helicobacter pylori]